MFSRMKQSSNRFKHTGSLTQYSSGEDDSGTEDIFTKKIFVFSGYFNRPEDLQQNSTLPPAASLKQNRWRTARLKQHLNKNVVRHRSPIVRARLWSEHCDPGVLGECGTVSESGMQQRLHALNEVSDQVSNCTGNANDNQAVFARHGSPKKSENCRKVLSDITKETVADYRCQFPSYFSRDVLPLDAEETCISHDSPGTVENKNNNNAYFMNNDCKHNEQTANGLSMRTRTTYSNIDMSTEFKTTEEKGWFSLHYQKVSMILVVIVLLFFFLLGLIYLNVRFKDAQTNLSESGLKYPVCDGKEDQASCIRESELNTVVSALNLITPHLMTKAHDSLCNASDVNGIISLSDKDVLSYIQHMNHVSDENAKQVLKNVKLLVLSNPFGDVVVVEDQFYNEDNNEIQGAGLLLNWRLAIKNPNIPLSCQLNLWFKMILSWMSSFTSAGILISGILVGLWNYKRRSEQHRQEVYMLVNNVINTVRNHHQHMRTRGVDDTPFIPIETCRNEIMKTHHARVVASAWGEAVRFIDQHESRILTEIQYIQGKPTRVWQWMCSTPQSSEIFSKAIAKECIGDDEPDKSSNVSPLTSQSSSSWTGKNRRNKVWQGQAFETIAGSPNSLPCSPTPCLKIRHMFDPDLEHGEDWPLLIQDSILEKCEDVCILHLFVKCSSQEGCVFMKCSSSEEAGKAYRALHGWWFDTKLVTVKYLRTERYHERFPEAENASKPLRPSNNQRLSLQELWHFPLEST